MSHRASASRFRRALALSSAVLLGPSPSGAQSLEPGIRAAGTFSETGLGLPLAEAEGGFRLGGSLLAGLELVGLPDSPWHLDLAGRYLVRPSTGDRGLALAGPELRAGYAFPLGTMCDIAPLVGVALLYPIADAAERTVLLSAGFKLDLYLGNWSWLSLVPQFSYPLGSGAAPSLGLGLGYKQLLAWGKARPKALPEQAARAAQAAETVSRGGTEEARSSKPSLSSSIAVSPTLFSPDEDGKDDILSILPRVDRPETVRSWAITVDDLSDQRLRSWAGEGVPPSELRWDGKSERGELVESAQDYSIELSLVDDEGRPSRAQARITTDVLVIRQGSRYKIRLPSILFTADSARLAPSLDEAFMKQNYLVLNRLAAIFQRFPEYRITIEGHANLVNWNDPALAAIEERKSSGPLSLQRAETVKTALIQLGIKADRIKSIGRGGQDPLVPASDAVNNWKNRRVEIFLDR